ncbi:MAG: VOC family protein [Proteobacteria bacterium]|nr:VOC family protein [Pseudomonadota bacterium]
MAAVHSIDAFVFTVPDLTEAERFYAAFGLVPRRVGTTLELYTEGHAQRWGVLHELPGARKKLQFLSFACHAADYAAIAARAHADGLVASEPHPLGSTDGLWLRHPEGYAVQVVVGPKNSPDAKAPAAAAVAPPPGRGAAPARSAVKPVRPRRLSHVLLFSGDVDRSAAFFEQALGLRVTDRSGDVIVFMRGIHGSDHHLVALAKSDGPGLHHVSWDVATLDDVGLGMEQMLQAGYLQGWGVGRHVLGSNYFYYVRDPWGSYCEYSFDIDFVPGRYDWPARDHPIEDSFYVWGPVVPPEFTQNHETAAR